MTDHWFPAALSFRQAITVELISHIQVVDAHTHTHTHTHAHTHTRTHIGVRVKPPGTVHTSANHQCSAAKPGIAAV